MVRLGIVPRNSYVDMCHRAPSWLMGFAVRPSVHAVFNFPGVVKDVPEDTAEKEAGGPA